MQHPKTVKLGEIIQQVRGVTYSGDEAVNKPTDGYLPIFRANNILQNGQLLYENLVYVPQKCVKPNQLVREGDIVIAASSGSKEIVGKAAFAKHDWKGSFGAFCKIVRAKNVLPLYLNYFFQTSGYRKRISQSVEGANINNLRNETLDCLEIPLPDLDTQRHIAAILDQADALRQKNRQLLTYYEQLPQAVFLEMFGDEQAIKHWYEAINLCEVADIVSGVTKNTKQTGTNYIDVPYMRVANVQDGRIDLSEIKTINVPPSDLQKFRLQRNDILLTEGGDPDKLGRGAVWHDEITDCIHQNHIFRVRPNQQLVNPTFLSFLIGSRYGKRYFLKAAKQTTGIASINMQQLKRFPAVVPPIEIQNQFSHSITEIEQQKKLAIAQLITGEALFQSLLHESFGEKV